MAARNPLGGEGTFFAAEDEGGNDFWGELPAEGEGSTLEPKPRTESGVILNPETGMIG